MSNTQLCFKHTGNKQKEPCTTHCKSATTGNPYKHCKLQKSLSLLENSCKHWISMFYECLNSKSAQQATFEQLAFRQAKKQPKSQLLFLLGFWKNNSSIWILPTSACRQTLQECHFRHDMQLQWKTNESFWGCTEKCARSNNVIL